MKRDIDLIRFILLNVVFTHKKGQGESFTEQGVYMFTDPEDKVVVYIGKTNTNRGGIGGRVRSHAGKGRRLQKKLGVSPEVFGKYNVRASAIVDASIRGATELHGISVHMPKGNLIALLTEGKPDFDPPLKSENLPILH